MHSGVIVGLLVVAAIVLVGAYLALKSKSAATTGRAFSIFDNTTINTLCGPGNPGLTILSAAYGPLNGAVTPTDVTARVQAAFSAGGALSVPASLGLPAASGGGVLTGTFQCASGSKSGFMSVPIMASGKNCDRNAALDYAVDSTIKGGSAMVWAPYVSILGADFAQPEGKKKVSAALVEWGFTDDAGGAGDKAATKEGFQPVPDLGRRACGPADDLEYRIDSSLRDAQPPQALLYSTISGSVPALGVSNPIETESDNTVTHLYETARGHRWNDPYLTDSAKFGRSPYDIPSGDPGSMEPLNWKESYTSSPALITAVTGRSSPFPRSVHARSRDISRHVSAYHTKPDDGFGGSDSDLASTRFNRAPLVAARTRGGPRSWPAAVQ